jgi:hypothetical protein
MKVKIPQIWKAIIAATGILLAALTQVVDDGQFETAEISAVVSAAVVAYGVYKKSNAITDQQKKQLFLLAAQKKARERSQEAIPGTLGHNYPVPKPPYDRDWGEDDLRS